MSHQAILSWSAPLDASSSSTYNIYRASAPCPASGLGNLAFTKLGNTQALTYTDTAVTVGNSYCYYATQLVGSEESLPSNTAGGNVTPFAVTIQLVLS